MVLRTLLARALGLRLRFDEGAAELDALGPEDELTPLVRTHLRLEHGRLLNSSGQRDASIPHFLRALETAEAAGLDVLAWLVSQEPERVRRLARLGSAGVPAE